MAEELKAAESISDLPGSVNKLGKPRDAREWTHQDEFMLSLEGQRIPNPLVYSKIKYPSHEWDNIPPVIPKFIINLEKYMEGLTEIVKRETELETTALLRKFTQAEINVSRLTKNSQWKVVSYQSN